MRLSQTLSHTSAALRIAVTLNAQAMKINGFVDVSAAASRGNNQPSAFAIGQYDLFVTSKLGERMHFPGETVFEYRDAGYGVDVERVIVSFDVSRAPQIGIGKHHIPIGYWNTAYHHGALLQPTAERPTMFRLRMTAAFFPCTPSGFSLPAEASVRHISDTIC